MSVRLDLPVSDDHLLRLSRQNPGWQFERNAEGKLLMSPTGGESGRRSGEVFFQITLWNRRNGFGVTFDSSTGFRLPDGSCLSPDAAWVRAARWEALTSEQRERYLPFSPDVAFEVRSTSDPIDDLRLKMRTYVANGTVLGVLIDPRDGSVELYRPGHERDRLERPARVRLDPELAGFTLDLEPIFA